MGSHQPHISGKCGTLGCTQTRGKSGSVDSDLQFLGLNDSQQDKGIWILTVMCQCMSLGKRLFCAALRNKNNYQNVVLSLHKHVCALLLLGGFHLWSFATL